MTLDVPPTGFSATVNVWQRTEHHATVVRLRLRAADRFGWLDITVPPGTPLPPGDELEHAVAQLASTLPPEERVEELERRSPLLWADGELAG